MSGVPRFNHGPNWVGKHGYTNVVELKRNRNISYWKPAPGGQDVSIEWNGRLYNDAPTYYKEVILSMPRTDGVVLGAGAHIEVISRLTDNGIYVADLSDSDIYVDGWRVNGSYLTHKHPEFGYVETAWSEGVIEADVLSNGACDLCRKKIPGEIAMMHHFYRLDG